MRTRYYSLFLKDIKEKKFESTTKDRLVNFKYTSQVHIIVELVYFYICTVHISIIRLRVANKEKTKIILYFSCVFAKKKIHSVILSVSICLLCERAAFLIVIKSNIVKFVRSKSVLPKNKHRLLVLNSD